MMSQYWSVKPTIDERKRADAPHQIHRGQVASRQLSRRHDDRSEHPAGPVHREQEAEQRGSSPIRSRMRNGSSTSSGPTTTSTHSVAYRSVHSSQGVRTVNTTASRRSENTLFAEWSWVCSSPESGSASDRRPARGSGRRNIRSTNAHREPPRSRPRHGQGPCGAQHAGGGRARRLLQRGADRPLEPVRREKLPRRQDARQDRAVRGEEEPRPGAQDERDDRELRDADRPERSDHDDRGDREELDELDTARTISRRDTRSATMPPGIAHSSSPVAFEAATSDSSSGPPPIAMTE